MIRDDGTLVAGPFPVTMGDRGAPPRPGCATVFTRADGGSEVLTRRPSALESRRYTYRFEVDTTDKSLRWELRLPSSAAGYFFRAELHVGWRVGAPEEVVKRGIATVRLGA